MSCSIPLRPGFLAILGTLALTGCNSSTPGKTIAPSAAEPVTHESELLRLKLTPEAVQRLGIATARSDYASATNTLILHGEVVVPPTGDGVPISATADVALLAVNQAKADGDVARATAEFEIAQRNAERADALVREEAGSARARDETQAAVTVARSNLRSFQLQRAQLGPGMRDLSRIQRVWIRVAVPVSDMPSLQLGATALVSSLGAQREQSEARAVPGPATGNAATGTLDLWYASSNTGTKFRIGQRVAVALPTVGQSRGLTVPVSAVLYDIHGGEWVYVVTGENTYERRRVEIASTHNGIAILSRGLASGVTVVTAGAAELFGTEFGAK
ncbi:MAG: efflux RND transporter periplasmic adaptor subunit [Pseudomonadota bacterium]